jgi:hypothetical protein
MVRPPIGLTDCALLLVAIRDPSSRSTRPRRRTASAKRIRGAIDVERRHGRSRSAVDRPQDIRALAVFDPEILPHASRQHSGQQCNVPRETWVMHGGIFGLVSCGRALKTHWRAAKRDCGSCYGPASSDHLVAMEWAPNRRIAAVYLTRAPGRPSCCRMPSGCSLIGK